MLTSLRCGAVALLIALPAAHAGFEARDSGFGEDTLVLDSGTGLEWLRLDQTRGRTWFDVVGNLDAGEAFEGLRVASGSEIGRLFRNAGILHESQYGLGMPFTLSDADTARVFIGTFGGVLTGSGGLAEGNFGTTPGTFEWHAGLHFRMEAWGPSGGWFDDGVGGDPNTRGFWMVRTAPVPETPTSALLLAGLALLGVWASHHRRRP